MIVNDVKCSVSNLSYPFFLFLALSKKEVRMERNKWKVHFLLFFLLLQFHHVSSREFVCVCENRCILFFGQGKSTRVIKCDTTYMHARVCVREQRGWEKTSQLRILLSWCGRWSSGEKKHWLHQRIVSLHFFFFLLPKVPPFLFFCCIFNIIHNKKHDESFLPTLSF